MRSTLRRTSAGVYLAVIVSLVNLGCSAGQQDTSTHGSTAIHLKRPPSTLAEPTIRRTVYVPVYSSIYLGLDVRRNVIELAATLTHRETPGSCFIPFHFREAAANLLTIDEIDPFGKIPEFKFCAVRVEPVGNGHGELAADSSQARQGAG